MVIGYVLCLFATGKPPQPSSSDQNSVTACVITVDQQKQVSGYQVSVHDFQPVEPIAEVKQATALFIPVTINSASESNFSTSDGLSFVDFSRPPPVIIS